ncbi:MAG: hypothetical protein H6838_12335 [Planctomycetes bacterium]|nr:hypothetical protein [Planctomycetota bacterium]
MRVAAAFWSVCLLSPVPALAQAVLLVGPTRPFTDIAAAIAAAAPGDRVLVEAGSYATFTLDKGVAVRAEPPGALVTVSPGAQIYVEVPAGEYATIEGLRLDSAVTVRRPAAAAVAGQVALVDVSVSAGIVLDTAELAIWRSQIVGFGRCIDVFGASALDVSQSTIAGRIGAWIPAIEGICSAGQARIRVGSSTITGGTAGFHNVVAASPAVRLASGDRAWFVDCTFAVHQQPVLATPALISTATAPVVFDRCTFTDNLGQPGATVGPVQNGLVLALTSNTPLARGGTFQLDFASRPLLPVVVHARFGLDASGFYPFLAGPDFGFVGSSLQFALRIADAQGHASVPVPIPNAPWVQDLPLWFAGWSELAMPVQMSPAIGGLIR